MNKFFICFLAICLTATSFAQNNVGIGTASPDPSAVLDLTAVTQGFLAPRTKVALVPTPAIGLVIYDTDSACYCMYNATGWKNLCSPGTAWLITGNSGTNSAVNFAGTKDAQDFVLKSNNAEVIRATTAGAVGINTPTPDPTSILDITSTTRGVLFPALTSAQRDAIAAPAVGLTIYDTDLNVHQFWNGTCWVNVGQTVCSFTYNTTQNQASGCLFKSNFGTVSDTLTVSLVSGTPSPVILSAAGVPAGVLVNFSNNYLTPTQSSVMTFTALPSAVDGTYTITILAVSGSTVQTLTYTLTVFDFAVNLSSADTTVSLAAAQSGNVIANTTVSIGNNSSCGSTAGNAILTVTQSNGFNVTFANPNPSVPGSTTMSISGSCAIAPGTYPITISSQVGVSITTAVYTVTVLGSAPIHISANTQNVNLFILAGQPSCAVTDTFYVDPGVIVGSDSAVPGVGAYAAMQTGNFPNGSHIVIINNGTIAGAGGVGGNQTGYGYLANCAGVGDGAPGGDAIFLGTPGVVINNNGTIGGGGGGGGAGGDLSITLCTVDARPGAGGGGGGGSVPGAGGNGGGGSYPANPGSAGSGSPSFTGGAGGGTTTQGPCFLSFGSSYNNGSGGSGGNLGFAGSGGGGANGPVGGTGVCTQGSGGAPGCGVKANSFAYVYNGAQPVGTSPTCP